MALPESVGSTVALEEIETIPETEVIEVTLMDIVGSPEGAGVELRLGVG